MVGVKNTSAILSLAGAISIIAVPVRADEPPQATAQVPVQADATVPTPASPAPAKTTEQGATEALGQVVVTAQKREQKLQDVPIAVTAITAKELESRGIQDIADLSALSPGLQVEKSPANGSISQVAIRGNVQINPAIYWDTAVGVYMDGVYLGKSQGSAFDVVDLNQLSGPGAPGYDNTKQVASNTEVKSYGLLNLRLALTQVPLGTAASGELALWARNVTNEAVATNMIDFGSGFGSLTEAYFNDPRTFGITGTVHF